MKVAVVFILLFATVLCRPARKVADSSESSEEVGRRPAAPALGTQADVPQNVVAAAGSDESTDSSDEDQAPMEAKSDSTDTTASPSTDSQDSDDSDDDDDDDDTDENDSSDSSESGEASTAAPGTATPAMVTEEPMAETTPEPIEPTIVTDTRGDSLGGPSDYKSIVYVEDKSYHKVPAPYKSYEFVGMGKKMAYDMTEDNEVDKSPKVYKALQVHSDILEEDTSTPEVESQSLDASPDQDPSPRQVSLPEEASNSDATTSESESSSAPEEEEEQEENASTASASQESEDEDSQSSEEATATPGAADSESDESAGSDSDEQGAGPDTTTDVPVVITAK